VISLGCQAGLQPAFLSPRRAKVESVAIPRHIRGHGRATASINSDLSALRVSGDRNYANGPCVAFYDCKGCGETLKPLSGSCCVFCSYGSVPCPPIQEGVEPCCTPKSDPRSKDWVGSKRVSLLAWWFPSAAIMAGLFASVPTRTIVWTLALALMGIACILNAQQCGRTHCRYTGPYYLAMIVPVAVVGLGIAPLTPYGWIALGILILGGGYVIWWATERVWGKFTALNFH
jgi:hypothetical protein